MQLSHTAAAVWWDDCYSEPCAILYCYMHVYIHVGRAYFCFV